MGVLRNQLRIVPVPRSHTQHERGVQITYELIDELVEATEKALHLEVACAKVGVTPMTVDRWLHDGRDMLERLEMGQILESQLTVRQARLVDLYIEMAKVIAENEISGVAALEKLIKLGDFRAIKFKLERTSHKRWGKKDHLTIDDNTSKPMNQEPRIVDYSSEIALAAELKALDEGEEILPLSEDVEEVEVLDEEKA